MQTAAEARQITNDVLSGLTFIDILVSGATISGLNYIAVPTIYLNTENRSTLLTKGYSVVPKYYSNDNPESGNPSTYIISW